MNNVSNDLSGWDHCDSGLLVALSNQAKFALRRRVVLRASATTLAVLLLVGFGVWGSIWWSGPREYYYGGIACHEVQANMPAMMAGTLPNELKTRIEAHLRECPVCQQIMQQMQTGQATASRVHEDRIVCNCPQCQRRYAQAVMKAVDSMEGQDRVVAMSLRSPSYIASN